MVMASNSKEINMDPLFCLGSLNAMVEDRFMERRDVVSFQYFSGSEKLTHPALNSMGALGLSSMAHIGDSIFITTGSKLFDFPLNGSPSSEVPITDIKDVHELTVTDGMLWLANTGMNELTCYDPENREVIERLKLPGVDIEGNSEDTLDTYHCNQCFTDEKGDLLAVVHHVDGKQHMVSITSRVINKLKKQGNGGIINSRTGEVIVSGMKGPHSARVLPDGTYVICDSGLFELCHFDKDWNLIRKTSTKGWSRGVDIGNEYIYVGVSETRKRYLDHFSGTAGAPNCILVFDIETFELVHEIVLKDIEQVNNLYIMTPEITEWFNAFKERYEQ